MEKTYNPALVEEKIYRMWENGEYFIPKTDDKKTLPAGRQAFSIILPPPNANADLHLGHAMYVIEDILVRYHRMKGDPTLWIPGADHAGFETQYVFEKELKKQGKSRFDFDRDSLYRMIWDFVEKNRGAMENQMRRLGFSLDWRHNAFTLDPKIIEIVYKTFKKLYDDGLVYRGTRLVNYCTRCGTGFSDLEVKHVERQDPLYYLKYGPFVLATVRPETKFGDTAVAVNPKDKRYKHWVGKEIEADGLLGKFTIRVIADDAIDRKFGTGVAKVTPAHDTKDFDIATRHNLPIKQVIGFDGRLTDIAGPYAGLKVMAAREKIAADLSSRGIMDHIDKEYAHTVTTCYKCGTVIEPLPLPQWYVKVKPLAETAVNAIKDKKITFVPKRFEKHAIRWLTDFHDWNISRQIVWGIRIPAWQCTECNEWTVTDGTEPDRCAKCKGAKLMQDADTFDTWFSSSQWPFATLRSTQGERDFENFYPSSVMETGYDILPWWVCRMMMVGIYATGDVPFKTVYLHGLVRDAKGQKMSKSKGNVINPLKMVDQYGADALRMALVYGTAAGNDQSLSEDKIRGMRNFANKIWNAARYVLSMPDVKNGEKDKELTEDLKINIKTMTDRLNQFKISQAADWIYHWFWDIYCDRYIELSKKGLLSRTVMKNALVVNLKLLHPFMPFVTEEIWGKLPGKSTDPLIVSGWPTIK